MRVKDWLGEFDNNGSKDRRVLLFDGSMGTYFSQKTGKYGASCETVNLTQPEIIEQIHAEYIEAGCQAIKTNTFGANSLSLDCDHEYLQQILEAGYKIASRAAANTSLEQPFVFADIGPVPDCSVDDEDAQLRACTEVIDIFLELGAQNFLFETLSDDKYIVEAVEYLKKRATTKGVDVFAIVSFAVQPDGYTRAGYAGKAMFTQLLEKPWVDACGFNCVSGAHHLLKLVQTLENADKTGSYRVGDCLLSVMPNAGYPTVVDNRTFYANTPKYFAQKMLEIVNCGARIIGGCCGTTPEFIRACRDEIDLAATQSPGINKQTAENYAKKGTDKGTDKVVDQVANRSANKGADKTVDKGANKSINNGRQIFVELDPPANADISEFMRCAQVLSDAGADMLTIADCPVARARVDASLLACKLKRELNIKALPHMTCRDRNINATKALLMGLNIENINNVLVVTGDPIPTAEKDEVKSVFNFNSRMLARYIQTLNDSIFEHSPFTIFGALNVNAVNFDSQLRTAEKKIASGMSGLLTQPILSEQGLRNLIRAHENLDVKIFAGIMPVVSYRNACFMNSEISGINVDEDITERYKDKDREECSQLAVEISTSFLHQTKDCSDGHYIITPFKRVDIVSKVIEQARKMK